MKNRSWWALSAFVMALLAGPARGTDFPHFDRMDSGDQSEYVAVMIGAFEDALRGANQAQDAARMHGLFSEIKPGDMMPLGLIMYGLNEDNARVLDAERFAKDHGVKRLEVEHALLITLKRNSISMSAATANPVFDHMANFHAMTYSEFAALAPPAQRQYIALLVRLAYPDYVIRNAAEERQQGRGANEPEDPATKQRRLALIEQQFPSAAPASQPGFMALSKEILAEYRKSPNESGLLHTVYIHILKMLDADVLKRMKQMEDSTYHLRQ